MIAKFINTIRTLGIDSDISVFERRRHEATNVFLFAVFCMVLALNLIYFITGAWLLWAANSTVVALMSLCFVALALKRVLLSRILFVVTASYTVFVISATRGPGSNFYYLAVLAALIVPLIIPQDRKVISHFAFFLGSAAFLVAKYTKGMWDFNPEISPLRLAIVEDTALLFCALAVYLALRKLVHFLTATNNEFDSLLQSLPDECLKVDYSGTILMKSGTPIPDWIQPQFKLVFEALAPESQRTLAAVLEAHKHPGAPSQTSLRLLSSGNQLTLDCTLRRMDEGVFLLLCRDRTEQVRQEDQSRINELKLYQASKFASLGEMAGGIAHEINTPLAVIIATSDQIRREALAAGLPAARIQKACERITKTSGRISQIIHGLRVFARDGSNDVPQATPVADILSDTMELCAERFRAASIVLNSPDLLASDLPVVMCRAVQVAQVIVNLLNNAFDAVSGKDEKWVKIEVDSIASICNIRITDSGTGIPPDLRDKIFQPFYTTKPVGKGTGLGLSVSRSMIEMLGGKLSLDENSDHTSFVISLALAHQDTESLQNAS
jgi:signal transduction histidine kinase